MTRDIDIVVQMRPEHIDAMIGAFPAPQFYVSRSAVEDAVRRAFQFNVIHPTSGNKIDFIVVGDAAWGASQIDRRRRIQFLPNFEGYVAAPDDVILGKLVYYLEGGSDKHLSDIEGIMRRSGQALDLDYLKHMTVRLGADDVWRCFLEQRDSWAPPDR
jgi:hypothetical protein